MTSLGMHRRWHINRNMYNPACNLCVAEGLTAQTLVTPPEPLRARRKDLPMTVTGTGGPDGIFGHGTGASAPPGTTPGSNTSRPFYVYGLHSGDGVYRYIGTSRNPCMRLAVHRSNSRAHVQHTSNKRLYEWTKSIGADLCMDLIDGPVFTMPETVEREWCFFFYTQGYHMLNLNPEYLTGWRKKQEYSDSVQKAPHLRWHVRRGLWNPNCVICVKDNLTGEGLVKTLGSPQARNSKEKDSSV